MKNSGLENQAVRFSMKDEDDDSKSKQRDESTSFKSEEALAKKHFKSAIVDTQAEKRVQRKGTWNKTQTRESKTRTK